MSTGTAKGIAWETEEGWSQTDRLACASRTLL